LTLQAAENCTSKESLVIPLGNGSSLGTTVTSVVFKDKTYNSIQHLIQVAGNGNMLSSKIFITQAELHEVLKVITDDDLNYNDLVRLKSVLLKEVKFLKLSEDQQKDAIKVIDDIISVQAKMEEDKLLYHYDCKYSLVDPIPLDGAGENNHVQNRTVRAVCKRAKK
jgi:hypothetical protein